MSDSLSDAKRFAFRLLRYRGRSEKELADRLTRKGFSGPTIAATVGSLKIAGLVDDASLARSLAEIAVNVRHLGDRGARQFLLSRGISEDLVAGTLTGEDELGRALAFARTRRKSLAPHPAAVQARKLSGCLLRKGYHTSTVRQVIAALYRRQPDD